MSILNQYNGFIMRHISTPSGFDSAQIDTFAIEGNNLSLTMKDGSTHTVDVSTLANDKVVTTANVEGDTLTLTLNDGSTVTASLAALVDHDDYIVSAEILDDRHFNVLKIRTLEGKEINVDTKELRNWSKVRLVESGGVLFLKAQTLTDGVESDDTILDFESIHNSQFNKRMTTGKMQIGRHVGVGSVVHTQNIGSIIANQNVNQFFHVKTGLNVNNTSRMFRFDLEGYAYGQSAVIDLKFVGYAYKPADGAGQIINTGVSGTTDKQDALIYKAENGDVYLRFKVKTGNDYYTNFNVSHWAVGNGAPIDSVEVIHSPLEFLGAPASNVVKIAYEAGANYPSETLQGYYDNAHLTNPAPDDVPEGVLSETDKVELADGEYALYLGHNVWWYKAWNGDFKKFNGGKGQFEESNVKAIFTFGETGAA